MTGHRSRAAPRSDSNISMQHHPGRASGQRRPPIRPTSWANLAIPLMRLLQISGNLFPRVPSTLDINPGRLFCNIKIQCHFSSWGWLSPFPCHTSCLKWKPTFYACFHIVCWKWIIWFSQFTAEGREHQKKSCLEVSFIYRRHWTWTSQLEQE